MLELVPTDLRDLARSQVHLEQRFTSLRDYLLTQTGRRSVAESLKPTINDMDIGAVQQETPDTTYSHAAGHTAEEHSGDAAAWALDSMYWWGKIEVAWKRKRTWFREA